MTNAELGRCLNERRFKICPVSHRVIVQAFNMWRCPLPDAQNMILSLPVHDGLPGDAYVMSMAFNHSTMTPELLVTHTSFEPVEEGYEAPRFPSLVTSMQAVPLATIYERIRECYPEKT